MSKTLAQLTADVLTIVKRPDLLTDIDLHVKNAILKAHTIDYWKADLLETTIQFAAPAIDYSLAKTTLIPRWRKISYMNTVDNVSLAVIRRLKGMDILNFSDQYNYIKDYSFYEAGANLQIRVSDSWQYFGLGVYLYPDVTLATPSWIADQIPSAIQYEAARTMFKLIGFEERSKSMESLVAEAMVQVRATGIPTIGE